MLRIVIQILFREKDMDCDYLDTSNKTSKYLTQIFVEEKTWLFQPVTEFWVSSPHPNVYVIMQG